MFFRENPYIVPTERQYALIGRVVAEWTLIDHLINHLLGRLMGAYSFPMRAITERLTGPAREAALSLLTDIHRVRYAHQILDEKGVAALAKVDRRYRALKRIRNDVAHLIWIRSNDEELFATGLTAQLPNAKTGRWKEGAVVKNSEIQDWLNRLILFGNEIEAVLELLPERDDLAAVIPPPAQN